MSAAEKGDVRGEPDPISPADYLGHEGRLIRLEEFRNSHEKMHEDHVATHAWVYKKGYAVAALIATIAATIAVAIIRVFL